MIKLETAKRLKEAGWDKATSSCHSEACNTPFELNGGGGETAWTEYPNPNSDELLDALPEFIDANDVGEGTGWDGFTLRVDREQGGNFHVLYVDDGYGEYAWKDTYHLDTKSLPEALAEMWIKLKEEGLIT